MEERVEVDCAFSLTNGMVSGLASLVSRRKLSAEITRLVTGVLSVESDLLLWCRRTVALRMTVGRC